MDWQNFSALQDAVNTIDNLVPDPRLGLPDPLFYLISRMTPLVNVDLLIVNECNQKLLTWRADQFYGPGWHLPGGIIRFKENAHRRIREVAKAELGATVESSSIPILVDELMNTERDIRGHFISMVFRCKLTSSLDESRRAASVHKADNGQWLWVSTMPTNMIKQHLRFEYLLNE